MIMSKFIKTPITLTNANSTKATSITNWIVESKFEKLTSIVEAATKFDKIAALTRDQKIFCLINNLDITRATFEKKGTVKYTKRNSFSDWCVVVNDFLKIGNTYRNIKPQFKRSYVAICDPEYVPPNIGDFSRRLLIVSDVKKQSMLEKFRNLMIST